MKLQYNQLISQRTEIDVLEVQSFEMNVYLVKITIGEVSSMLYKGDSLMRFYSTQHIRDAFEEHPVKHAVMVHESPYDEMIGNPPSADKAMAMPFSMTQPY